LLLCEAYFLGMDFLNSNIPLASRLAYGLWFYQRFIAGELDMSLIIFFDQQTDVQMTKLLL
jgi:hypothetical protein